jgi:hypothetical protein
LDVRESFDELKGLAFGFEDRVDVTAWDDQDIEFSEAGFDLIVGSCRLEFDSSLDCGDSGSS